MIKIIAGMYGHHNGKAVETITAADPPFELTPEQEQRLVNAGIAEYVNTEITIEETANEETDEETEDCDEITLESLSKLKMSELKIYAKEYGISPVGIKKVALAEKIYDAMMSEISSESEYTEDEEDEEILAPTDPLDAII